jgi:putative tricarboxylic transport membrane protein
VNRVYQIAAVALFLGSGSVAAYAWLQLQYYTRLGPGPGFFPFWLAVLTAVLSAQMFYAATFKGREPLPEGFFPSPVGRLRIAAIVASLAAAGLAMEPLGFRLTMLAFLAFLMWVLARAGVLLTAAIALVGSFGVYELFVKGFKIVLPLGPFGL